jgi:hypothetical protein
VIANFLYYKSKAMKIFILPPSTLTRSLALSIQTSKRTLLRWTWWKFSKLFVCAVVVVAHRKKDEEKNFSFYSSSSSFYRCWVNSNFGWYFYRLMTSRRRQIKIEQQFFSLSLLFSSIYARVFVMISVECVHSESKKRLTTGAKSFIIMTFLRSPSPL